MKLILLLVVSALAIQATATSLDGLANLVARANGKSKRAPLMRMLDVEEQGDFIADALAIDPHAFDLDQPGIFPSDPEHDWDNFPQDEDTRETRFHIESVQTLMTNDHGDDSDSEACNEDKAKPYVRPVVSAPSDFNLYPRSFSAYGYFDYDTAGMQMPIELHYDADTNSLVVNHTTTYHYFPGTLSSPSNQSAIAINTALSAPVPVWSAHRQSYFGGVLEWTKYQRTGFKTDGRIRKTDRGYKIKRYFGRVRDHHKPQTQRATVVVDQIACEAPDLVGLPKRMTFTLVFPCSEQEFDWVFVKYKIGKPPTSVFKAPFFFFGNSTQPYGNIRALPAYENAVFNRNCATVAVPPVP
jgi:hypothetical protein